MVPSAVSLAGVVADQAVPTGGSAVLPFAALTLSDTNPQAVETATVSLSGTGGTLSNLGTGQLSQDGLTYTAIGLPGAVQVNLQGLAFAPADGSEGSTASIGLRGC